MTLPAVAGAQSIPAGCPGGPTGPKNPSVTCPSESGTYEAECPNGTTVTVRDDLPPKCGGAGAVDSPAANASTESSTNGLTYKKDDCSPAQGQKLNKDNCGIIKLIVIFTNILSGLVGIVLVLAITIGGIQYATAGGNPSTVSAARKKIYNAVIALALFIFGYALLQYLIPGGAF